MILLYVDGFVYTMEFHKDLSELTYDDVAAELQGITHYLITDKPE